VARLGELERKVMEVLWESMGHPLTGRQVADQLPDRAYTTVLTILERLRRKRLVERRSEERVHRFLARASRENYMAELMVEALDGGADRAAILVRFAHTVTPAEATVLRRALADLAQVDGEAERTVR
jgi:predicted transcriptional regulator